MDDAFEEARNIIRNVTKEKKKAASGRNDPSLLKIIGGVKGIDMLKQLPAGSFEDIYDELKKFHEEKNWVYSPQLVGSRQAMDEAFLIGVSVGYRIGSKHKK